MRSYLYVPGDQQAKLAKAVTLPADAIIVDLEDAVARERKDEARSTVRAWLVRAHHPALWVRISADGARDAAALASRPVAGIVVPKASVELVDDVAGRFPGVPLCALLETAQAIYDARVIAAHPRVVRLAIGEADLGAELGLHPSDDARELLPMRMQVVLASAAAGIEPPVGPVATDFRDLEALRASSVALSRMGFGGRAAIHPAQIDVINDAFTPSREDVAAARALLQRHDGSGAAAEDGVMVDEAVLRAARRIIARARDEA